MPTNTTAGTREPDESAELRRLATRLEAEARDWRRRGLLGLADRLQEAAETARGWISEEE